MPIKDGLLNFRKRFGFKSADQEAADEFPDTTEKIVEEKEYLAKQVFNADKRALFQGEKMPQRSFISKEEK